MQNKVAFVVLYFGTLPEHFPAWLKSCENNPDFTWFLFTDDTTPFDYPQNVIVVQTTLQNIKTCFEQKLGFCVALNRAYKLCDFRPLYGYLFAEYLKDFTHWGYCDVDLLFGRLSTFVTQEDLQNYDKINVLGHISVIKNTPPVNEIFTKCNYKEILQDSRSRIFDEMRFEPNVNSLLKNDGHNINLTIPYADIDPTHYSFGLYKYSGGSRAYPLPRKPLIFEYKSGVLCGYELDKSDIVRKEFAYVHFQKRKIQCNLQQYDHFLLVPNQICDCQPITRDLIQSYSKDSLIYWIKNTYKRVCNAVNVRLKFN